MPLQPEPLAVAESIVDDRDDLIPAFAWTADISVDDVKKRLDELRAHAHTSRRTFSMTKLLLRAG